MYGSKTAHEVQLGGIDFHSRKNAEIVISLVWYYSNITSGAQPSDVNTSIATSNLPSSWSFSTNEVRRRNDDIKRPGLTSKQSKSINTITSPISRYHDMPVIKSTINQALFRMYRMYRYVKKIL